VVKLEKEIMELKKETYKLEDNIKSITFDRDKAYQNIMVEKSIIADRDDEINDIIADRDANWIPLENRLKYRILRADYGYSPYISEFAIRGHILDNKPITPDNLVFFKKTDLPEPEKTETDETETD